MTVAIRSAAVVLAVGATVLTAGCHRRDYAGRDRGDRALAVTTRLECPESQGDLRRTDAAADGRSCRYSGPDGQEVTLAYLALAGRSPQDALASTEADLRAAVPAAAANEPGSVRASDDEIDKGGQADRDDRDDDDRDTRGTARLGSAPGVPTPPRPPEPPQVDRSWSTDTHADGARGGDRVHINLPFLHIDADGDGRARVRTFGVDVDANDGGAVVRTPGGGSINARHDGAEMRFGSVGRRRADLVYIVASDQAGPQGWRSGAYVAKGPTDGPLVLAVTRSRHDSEGAHDGDLRDVKRLVNANVRGRRGFDLDID